MVKKKNDNQVHFIMIRRLSDSHGHSPTEGDSWGQDPAFPLSAPWRAVCIRSSPMQALQIIVMLTMVRRTEKEVGSRTLISPLFWVHLSPWGKLVLILTWWHKWFDQDEHKSTEKEYLLFSLFPIYITEVGLEQIHFDINFIIFEE